ncbi:MAG: hypothetical protein V2A58_14465 [Planctomycetota bacterium]
MRAMQITLTALIVVNAVLAVTLLAGNLTYNTAGAQTADRAGEYVAVTGMISSSRDCLYLINTRDDRLAVFLWSDPYKRMDLLANIDLREAFATAPTISGGGSHR